MAENIRGTHVSPGIYTKETDITYAVKSLGITTLGVVGETLKGPAFQPMLVENWKEFQNLFGGTSTEKFIGSQYPKYELPYIAKSYLSESHQLQVCRVLGLSGYNAGPAWAITASDGAGGKKMVVAILRSRGHYEKYYSFSQEDEVTDCSCPTQIYDKLVFDVGEVKRTSCKEPQYYNTKIVGLNDYKNLSSDNINCTEVINNAQSVGFSINQLNMGKFKICGIKGNVEKDDDIQSMDDSNKLSSQNPNYFEYSVSLNPSDKDYILKVLGDSPFNGTAPLYVESLYDVALQEGIKKNKLKYIDSTLETYNSYNVLDYCILNPVSDILTIEEKALTKKHVGTRWIATDTKHTCHSFDYRSGNLFSTEAKQTEIGQIYTVQQVTNEQGQRQYYYGYYEPTTIDVLHTDKTSYEHIIARDYIGNDASVKSTLVKNNYDGRYYRLLNDNGTIKVVPVLCDLNNYKDSYRYASTPWFVSNLKGDATHFEVNKLFRFHTISDGNISNNEVKVSIQNIRPDNKTFDVIVRDINDSDESIIVLEKYTNCTLIPGDKTYIAYKIGSFDGIYESKSKYITVEVNENLVTQNSVPCGFLGYPLAQYDEVETFGENTHMNIEPPKITYRVDYDIDMKNRRQYFGLSNSVGVDIDMFTYKGQMAYGEGPEFLSHGFHLDSRINDAFYNYKKYSKMLTHTSTTIESHGMIAKCDGLGNVTISGQNDNTGDSKLILQENIKLNPNHIYCLNTNISYSVAPKDNFGLYVEADGMSSEANEGMIFSAGDMENKEITKIYYKVKNGYTTHQDITFNYELHDLTDMFGEGNEPKTFSEFISQISQKQSNITVDGVSGYLFDCVDKNNKPDKLTESPIIGTEVEMEGSLYEHVDLRKFTAYFYGGFDGWDIYRESRTNTDDFKITKYQGDFNTSNGEGYAFNRIVGGETLGLNQQGITSDWYAYLVGIRQFANPEAVDINVFATPGIDIINNTSLVEETIDMIEEERADSIYVVTTPDKPFGADDYVDEMYTSSDIVYELENTLIDSNYTCTYYPWVKYHDTVNNKYIFLPPTKDVVRNMAMTDNTAHPWFAPAGITRGDVDCVRAKLVTKLSDEDVLYEGRINPVKTFASDGVKIWGQKNLQIKESQLNRIAVRRLLLRLRKLISISCIGLIFEPNDPTTKNKFLSIVSPIFDNIKSNRGISDYRIEVNDSPEARDRRELPVKLYFKPYQALEYITLDFVVTPESVSFDDI